MSDTTNQEDWYFPGPSIREFHRSKKKVRVLIGGRGSGKTTAIAVETALKHGLEIAGSRVYILRKTQESNKDTTGETFDQVFAKSGSAYIDTGVSLFKKIEGGRIYRIPSRKAVEKYAEFLKEREHTKSEIVQWLDSVGSRWCSHILFAGVPNSSVRSSRFRGFECSMLILVEADQFDRDDLDMAMACLRWRSSDPAMNGEGGYIKEMSMILDTNPPSPRHWIAKLEEQESKDPASVYQFWHIHSRENSRNLPPGYVDDLARQYRSRPALYKRMIEGQYAEAFEGNPVLWAFTQEHAHDNLPFPSGAFLVRGWDFGTTNATVWSAYWEEEGIEYWWDLLEHFATSSDTETQCRRVLEMTEKVFPFWNDRSLCAGVLDWCDPAGAARRDTGRSISVLNSYQIYPAYKRHGLQDSIALYNRLLENRDKKGKLVYRIDRQGCPMLLDALSGGYRYPADGEPGFGSDEPLKGPAGGNYDHIADASRYPKIGCMRLLASGAGALEPVGVLARRAALNRPRRF